jgi:hypothetical protein
MKEPYSDYKEIGMSKEGLFKKASKMVGNIHKPKMVYKFGTAKRELVDLNDDENIDLEYLNPFESSKDHDELRKRKPSKSKSKRKTKKTKGCGCK